MQIQHLSFAEMISLRWEPAPTAHHRKFRPFSSLNNLPPDLVGWFMNFLIINPLVQQALPTYTSPSCMDPMYPHVSCDITVVHQPNLRPRQGEWQSWDPWRFQRGSPIAMVQSTDRPGPKCGRKAMPQHPVWLLPCPGFAVSGPDVKL